MRDCENCKNHTDKGCTKWKCEFEPTTKDDLGVDLISRADVLKLMQDNWHTHNGDWAMQESMDDIRALPSVTPQEPCENNICDSCHTKGCIFQSGIKRVNCEFYTAQNESCNDAISRESLLNKLCGYHVDIEKSIFDKLWQVIKDMPSVTPQPRKGHWIEEFNDLEGEVRFTCSSCGKYQLFGTDFCYHCGSDNREVEE